MRLGKSAIRSREIASGGDVGESPERDRVSRKQGGERELKGEQFSEELDEALERQWRRNLADTAD